MGLSNVFSAFYTKHSLTLSASENGFLFLSKSAPVAHSCCVRALTSNLFADSFSCCSFTVLTYFVDIAFQYLLVCFVS